MTHETGERNKYMKTRGTIKHQRFTKDRKCYTEHSITRPSILTTSRGMMQSFSMFPVVDKPTRVYGKSATLKDNIFINNLENNIISGNIVSDTTDHFSQMCILTSQCKIFYPNNKTKVRDYSTLNTKSFNNDLQNINWTSVCNIPTPINRSPGFTNSSIRQLINTPL